MRQAIDPEYIRIHKIAICPDSAIEIYRRTPIFDMIFTRRIIAREIDENNVFNKESDVIKMLYLQEAQLKEYLIL